MTTSTLNRILNQPESIKELRKKVLTLPYDPGVYMMKNKEGKIIYIGKAKNLRKRVLSYFNHKAAHDTTNWKTSKLISKIQDVDFLVTDNEIEAFLLALKITLFVGLHHPKALLPAVLILCILILHH